MALSGVGDALPEGVTARTVQTPRLATHLLESGVPVVFVHGNVSSSLFFGFLGEVEGGT